MPTGAFESSVALTWPGTCPRLQALLLAILFAAGGCIDQPVPANHPLPAATANSASTTDTPEASAAIEPTNDKVMVERLELEARVEPAEVRRGTTAQLLVTVTIAPGWHIYALDRPAGVAQPTTLTLHLPPGLEQTGDWTGPEPQLAAAPGVEFTHHGTVEFRCPLKVATDATLSAVPIECMVNVQACDEVSCAPPAEVALQTRLRIVP